MMGDGEDFVGAIKRLLADSIKKAGGNEEEMGDMDLEQWVCKKKKKIFLTSKKKLPPLRFTFGQGDL